MFQKLANHNEDLRRLLEKGYAVAIDSGFLIIRDIPYLNSDMKLQSAAFVAKLKFIDNNSFVQQDHQIYFTGSVPYGLDGKPVPNLGGGTCSIPLSEACNDIAVQRSFSNKPISTGKYLDHFHKIDSYTGFIAGPAEHLFGVSPLTFKAVESIVTSNVFKFHDTLTSRAGIGDLTKTLESDVIAIIGLGGTGAYLLDFLVKAPVKEIRGFDSKQYYVHTAFRSPGALDPDELGVQKTDVYQRRYENFRHGLVLEDTYINRDCLEKLAGVTFAFVCVDQGDARADIFDLLIDLHIPFIDAGMGLKRKNGGLRGLIRTTYFPSEISRKVRERSFASENEDLNNLYKENIQISELNAINASIAVIRYKQTRGFYSLDDDIINTLFSINSISLSREFKC